MTVDHTIQNKLAEIVLKRDTKEREERIESGRLTASMLGMPLQWQILKMIGVPSSPKDEYTLRKFQRGRDVEDWIIGAIGATEPQKRAKYREVTGKIDGLFEFNGKTLPLEIKSVANAKFKWIKNRRSADLSHCLQGALYGLSEGTAQFAICYVASDDYRTMTFICDTTNYKDEVDSIISRVDAQIMYGVVPVFEVYGDNNWQAKPEYQNYPEWQHLTLPQIMDKLEREHPDSFKTLMSGVTVKEATNA